jgi:hypothetical protein
MHDATTMLDWVAKEIYDPRVNRFNHYIVPEGVQMSTDGRYWYHFGDLGNGVQEAEIIKTLRLVIGVDDTHPARLQFYPRLPYGWTEMAVDKYPVVYEKDGSSQTAFLSYKLRRDGRKLKLAISADQDLGVVPMRLGPFEKKPDVSDVQVNGQTPVASWAVNQSGDGVIEHSGDSWWVKCNMPVKPSL